MTGVQTCALPISYTIRVSNPDGGQSGIFEFAVGPPVPMSFTRVENAASYALGIE